MSFLSENSCSGSKVACLCCTRFHSVYKVTKRSSFQVPGEKTERDPASCLGQVSVVRVVTGGRIKSDTSLYANVTLESCILDDTRPQSEKGVTRWVELRREFTVSFFPSSTDWNRVCGTILLITTTKEAFSTLVVETGLY